MNGINQTRGLFNALSGGLTKYVLTFITFSMQITQLRVESCLWIMHTHKYKTKWKKKVRIQRTSQWPFEERILSAFLQQQS